MQVKFKLSSVIAAAVLAACAGAAHADYVFSGSGASGNLTPGAESWAFNFSGSNNWGSPGVGAGVTSYNRVESAYGFDISFVGATILASSVAIGNSSGCAGGTGGGTTFCTTPFTSSDIWLATLIDEDTIAFRAQNPIQVLNPSESYFVNIFFNPGSLPTSFTGAWITTFAPDPTPAPEPSSLALLGLAMTGLVLARRKAA